MGLRINFLLALTAIGCSGGPGFVDAPPEAPAPGGTFTLAWQVTDVIGTPIDCAPIGATNVAIELVSHQSGNGFSDSFSCASGTGISRELDAGSYDVLYTLEGKSGTLASGIQQVNQPIVGEQTTTLDKVTFAVDDKGALALHMNSLKTGGNCGTIAKMGAGITGVTIALQHSPGGCEPLTLTIGPGATQPGGTYVINCASPVVAPCIENDQALTANKVPADHYQIKIRGKIGATDCWANDDQFDVPPLGKTYSQTLNLQKLSNPGC